MKTIKTVTDARSFVRQLQSSGKKVALVPTMGALHEGHISLIKRAKECADEVIASIFVNPLQFNVKEDLDNYPQTIESDSQKLNDAGCAMLFLPTVEEIYPDYQSERFEDYRRTKIVPGSAANGFCGATRPGHFDGVVTVVATLFNILPVDCAVFGEKDYQQLKVIEQMVDDLHLPVEIIAGKLIRDELGLALSSRNLRLSKNEYNGALAIPRILAAARDSFASGNTDVETLLSQIKGEFAKERAISLDYIDIVDTDSLRPLSGTIEKGQILFAGFVGPVRLIDNWRLEKI